MSFGEVFVILIVSILILGPKTMGKIVNQTNHVMKRIFVAMNSTSNALFLESFKKEENGKRKKDQS
tara:strand:- start:779 stop:976 length:198 start_codon:yes stop_codon:yes gene_type:complete